MNLSNRPQTIAVMDGAKEKKTKALPQKEHGAENLPECKIWMW